MFSKIQSDHISFFFLLFLSFSEAVIFYFFFIILSLNFMCLLNLILRTNFHVCTLDPRLDYIIWYEILLMFYIIMQKNKSYQNTVPFFVRLLRTYPPLYIYIYIYIYTRFIK